MSVKNATFNFYCKSKILKLYSKLFSLKIVQISETKMDGNGNPIHRKQTNILGIVSETNEEVWTRKNDIE